MNLRISLDLDKERGGRETPFEFEGFESDFAQGFAVELETTLFRLNHNSSYLEHNGQPTSTC